MSGHGISLPADCGATVSPPDRHEFGSAEWVAAFQGTMAACVAIAAIDHPDLTFSMSEVVTDPPPHIDPGGWSCRVRDGRVVAFHTGGADDIDYVVTADYAVMKDLCRFEVGGDAERAAAYKMLTRSLWEAGKISTRGALPQLPKAFACLHDVVARMTD